MNIEELGSLLAGLAVAFLLVVYFVEATRERDRGRLSLPAYALHVIAIGGLLLGGGEFGGALVLSSIVESGDLGFYLIGLNGLFFPVAGVYYIGRLFLQG